MRIFMILALTLSSSLVFSNNYTDEELLTKTIYELELIPKKHLSKDQKKLVKNQMKLREKKDCTVKQDEFFEIPLSELQSLNEKDMSKSESKMYSFILKNREKLQKIRKIPSFSSSRDDFEGTTKFRTSQTIETGFSKNYCPFSSWTWRTAGVNYAVKWFARAQTTNGTDLDFLQFYLSFSPSKYEASWYEADWYYGVTRIVGKGYGQLNHSMIDYSFSITEDGTRHSHDIGIDVTKEELAVWYESGEDVEIKIYSQTGRDRLTKIPYLQISTIYEGIVEAGIR